MAKAVSPVNIISGSAGLTLEVQSGTQNTLAYAQLDVAGLRTILNQVNTQSAPGLGLQRAVIKGVVTEFIVTNSTNMPIELDIYSIVCKRDLVQPTLSFVEAATGYTYTAVNSPDAYWATGLNAQQGFDPASLPQPQPFQMLTSKPTDSHLFNDFFKITKTSRVMLAAASSHKHIVNISVNKYIDECLANNQIGALKGFTTFTMFCGAGFPLALAETGAVTTNAAAVNVVRSTRVKYNWVSDTSYTSTFSTTLPINSSLIDQAIIVPATGEAGVVSTEPPV